jgi:hypothetical protein
MPTERLWFHPPDFEVSMLGRITTMHLFTHGTLIIREYGWETYLAAWLVCVHGGTFLEAVRKGSEWHSNRSRNR